MPIITISRGSYSKGKEIAEKVADRLGYVCLSRALVHKEASEQNKIPEIKLVRAIHDAPRILERLGYKKERYVALLRNVILRHFRQDKVVYHGLAGHFLVMGVPHALKVRILADTEDRIRWEMERERIPEKEAKRIILKDDEERRKWSQFLYGMDPWDPRSYDLILQLGKITVDDAVDIICHVASLPQFQATDASRRIMDDLIMAAEVHAALIDYKPDVEITCKGGIVAVRTSVSMTKEAEVVDEIRRIALTVPGVNEVNVNPHSTLMGL